jgi:hypothetical protein
MLDPLAACHTLNQTTTLTDTIQQNSLHVLIAVQEDAFHLITRRFVSRLHLARYAFEAPPDC